MTWTARSLSVAEAATMAGIPRAHLDVVLHRTRGLATLYSAKTKGRRWFSPRDIAVLRVALELERAGRNWATAIAQAYQHVAKPPPLDAILIVPVRSVSATSGSVVTGLPDPLPSGSFIVIPIGALVAEITKEAENLVAI